MDSIKVFFGIKQVSSQKSSELQRNVAAKQMKPSQIFKLDLDCFDEIFEYLSLIDLHSLAQTCTALQQMTGKYFRRNYIGAEKFTNDDGIYTMCSGSNRVKLSSFNKLINYTSHYHNEHGPFRYIERHSNEFEAINEIYLVCCEINEMAVNSLRSILPKIVTVRVRQCSIVGDFYEKLLQFCGNLKAIYVQDDIGDIIKERTNPWLLREYPSLEIFQLTARNSFKITDLNKFFDKNPNIRRFVTTSGCLWKHRIELLQCQSKLDILEIYDGFHIQSMDMQTFCNLLNQLHEHGFYKWLHLNVTGPNQECGQQFVTLQALQSISIMNYSEHCCISRLIKLQELTLYDGFNGFQMEILAKNLIHLRCLCLYKATFDDVMPFVQHSVKLHKIQTQFDADNIDLDKLNEQRAKLSGAHKIIIYVPDNNFLATKWTTKNGDTRLGYVEMRRSTSVR